MAKGDPKGRNPNMTDLSRPQAGEEDLRNRLRTKEVPVIPGMPRVELVLIVPLAIDKEKDIEIQVRGAKTRCHGPTRLAKIGRRTHSLVPE